MVKEKGFNLCLQNFRLHQTGDFMVTNPSCLTAIVDPQSSNMWIRFFMPKQGYALIVFFISDVGFVSFFRFCIYISCMENDPSRRVCIEQIWWVDGIYRGC